MSEPLPVPEVPEFDGPSGVPTAVRSSPPAAPTVASSANQGWTPEVIEALAQNILPYVDRFLKLQESQQSHEAKLNEVETRWKTRMTISLLVFAALVIGVMSPLTAFGRVSGDALLFLVGSTMGALFTMIYQQLLGQPQVIVASDD